MCRVLNVSASGYYGWRTRPECRRKAVDAHLVSEIRVVHEQSRQAYGSLKTWKALNQRGVRCGKHRVARLRRLAGICARRRRRFKLTTDSKHTAWIAPNLLNRHFTAERPNQVWVGDVTSIPTRAGWLYLAVLLDLYSRKVIGWSMSERIDKRLVLDALDMALARRAAGIPVVHHTDRGAIYASDEYRSRLASRRFISSMSRKGDCYDNAVAESFFSTLKNELLIGPADETRDCARVRIFEYIEVFYNRQRIHQSLAYITPEQKDATFVPDLECPQNPG